MVNSFMAALAGLMFFSQLAFSAQNAVSIVPKLNLEYWNSDSNTTYNNNCYNYSTNRVTDSFAQPGEASGKMYEDLTCESVFAAASEDLGLIPTAPYDHIRKEGDMLIALVVAPGWDFHWYRRDDNNLWSHKMGGTPATDTDESGNKIIDIEAADRGDYTEFCGYFRIINTPTEEHEQNGGQVRIGNMTDLPNSSEVRILQFSGRRNPSISLAAALQDSKVSAALLNLHTHTMKIREQKNLFSLIEPHKAWKLGGVQINDAEGLLGIPNTLYYFNENTVVIKFEGGEEEVHRSPVLSAFQKSLSLVLARQLAVQ